MERNWLIRTTDNQLLGPIGKAKLLEFYQKNALNLDDEISSGNGYWFSIKEKDLVEKYLIGDVPQSYNPISEAKTVLANKENPEKTSSLNISPANSNQNLKKSDISPGVLPKNEDLEYPDLEGENSIFKNSESEMSKFQLMNGIETTPAEKKSPEFKLKAENIQASSYQGEVILPNEEDLEFPDIDSIINSKVNTNQAEIQVEEERDFTVVIKKENVFNDRMKSTDTEEVKKAINDSNINTSAENFQKKSDELKLTYKIYPKEKKSIEKNKNKSLKTDTENEMKKIKNTKTKSDNYMFYILVLLSLIVMFLFVYYYKTILNKPILN